MYLPYRLALALLAALVTRTALTQTRFVALTFDDLPFVAGSDTRPIDSRDAKAAKAANRKILTALVRHHVPTTGFVIDRSVEQLGSATGTQILKSWVSAGMNLGNHTYAHPNFNDLTVAEFEDQVVRGEATFAPLMKAAGRPVQFFRFPFNHTGDTQEKHDALAAFLAARGYRLAPCTVENSDWLFAARYQELLAQHDAAAARRLRRDYLRFTTAQIDYFARLNKQVLGYQPPQIMLLHDNQLNADVIGELLSLVEQRNFKWVSLDQAEQDPVYREPDTFVTSYGPMWGYRWARLHDIKVDGTLEPEPPEWISASPPDTAPARRPRSHF
jgi:peptidoglycan-N-acetylglucosamine deacetylase